MCPVCQTSEVLGVATLEKIRFVSWLGFSLRISLFSDEFDRPSSYDLFNPQ